jgi:hypothetical protein
MSITAEHSQPQTAIDDPMVLTPGGYRRKSTIHRIEPGHHLEMKDGRFRKIHTLSGNVVKDYGAMVPEKKQPVRNFDEPKRSNDSPFPDSGWITDTKWDNTSGSAISTFNTSWLVPPEPSTKNNQLIFIFNGLQQPGVYILQPVLQWGVSGDGTRNYGGNYWSISNWYVPPAGSTNPTFVGGTEVIRVNPGDSLQGIMSVTGQSPTGVSYTSGFAGFPAVDLNVNNIPELKEAVETLECYRITKVSDYPVRKISMNSIFLKNNSGQLALNWTIENRITSSGQHAVALNNNSLNEEVDLYCYTVQNFAVGTNGDGRLEVFYTSVNQAIYHLWQVAPNSGWSTDAALGTGNFAKQLCAATNFDGRLEAFYVGTNDEIYHNWQKSPGGGDWSGENGLGGLAKQIVVGTNADKRLEVFYIGTNDQLYHNWQESPGGNWAGESGLTGLAKQIVIASNQDGRLELFYIGTNDELYHNWQNSPNGNWIGEAALGGAAKQIAIGKNQDGRLELFYVGTDDVIYHNWQFAPNSGWSGEVSMEVQASQLSAALDRNGCLELIYIGLDNQLYRTAQTIPNGGWGGIVPMGGHAASQLSLNINEDGRLELFYLGTDSRLYHNWQAGQNNGWSGEFEL